MFSSFVKVIGDYFGKRWLFAGFFPSLLFWALGSATLVLHHGPQPFWQEWTSQTSETRIILATTALIGVALCGYVLTTLQLPLTRLYEGYWSGLPILDRIAEARRERARRRQLALQKTVERLGAKKELGPAESEALRLAFHELTTYYPMRGDRVMPTRLGNVLRAAETYPESQYGINTATIWPRAYPLLPTSFVALLDGARTALNVMLNMSAVLIGFSLLWGVYWSAKREWLMVILSALGLPAASVFYSMAIHPGVAYAVLVRTTFDLYRWDLLKKLRWPLPPDSKSELDTWKELNQFLYQGIPTDVRYVHSTSAIVQSDEGRVPKHS